MARYLVTVTALADVCTYVVVEAEDTDDAREKAVREIQRDGAEWRKGERPARLLDATKVELLTRSVRASGPEISSNGKVQDLLAAD